jgi:hypothetical protein
MPISRGNLHITQIGSGFGRRQQSDFIAQAVQIAKALKASVDARIPRVMVTIARRIFLGYTMLAAHAFARSRSGNTKWSTLARMPNRRVDDKPCGHGKQFVRSSMSSAEISIGSAQNDPQGERVVVALDLPCRRCSIDAGARTIASLSPLIYSFGRADSSCRSTEVRPLQRSMTS